jgi:hypothetical protein
MREESSIGLYVARQYEARVPLFTIMAGVNGASVGATTCGITRMHVQRSGWEMEWVWDEWVSGGMRGFRMSERVG